ncbi:hypothetical protein BJV74DRAFT_402936 [Russula compacta]|nr:hypothetical protein BJV74DRAFT_402936 [Russula compacta]
MCRETITWASETLRVSRAQDKKDGEYSGLRYRERKWLSARARARQLSPLPSLACSSCSHKTLLLSSPASSHIHGLRTVWIPWNLHNSIQLLGQISTCPNPRCPESRHVQRTTTPALLCCQLSLSGNSFIIWFICMRAELVANDRRLIFADLHDSLRSEQDDLKPR